MVVIGNRARVHVRRGGKVALAILCLFFAGATTDAHAADAPSRAARLSYLQGSVTVDQVNNTGSDPAQLNMPLAQGTRVMTGGNGQAEIEFEDGSLVRLTPNSSMALIGLSADGNGNFQTNLTLGYGLAYAELRAAAKFVYSVDAGGEIISPVVNATVRIAMDKPPAAISVLDGTVQIEHSSSSGGESYRTNVNSGETLTGDAGDPGRYSLTREVADNSWDKWNDDRDRNASQETANQTAVRDDYAGEAGYGWSDLDSNGSWYNVPGEGEIWQPNVALDPGFDPYGFGSWVWYPGSGYVWASGYGWGWTPYRCGNWSYWGGFGWGWLPGNGCGFGGSGFGAGGYGGGGYVINVVRPPLDYHFRPVPVHSPGQIHPIRVGHPMANSIQAHPIQGPRTIAGHTLEPVRPVRPAGAGSGIRTNGASLQRDFPVDRVSHRPVLGKFGGQETAAPGNGVRPGAMQPGVMRPVNPRTGPQTGARTETEGREAPAVRPMRSDPPMGQLPVRPQQEQGRPVAPQSAPRSTAPAEPRSSISAQPRYSQPVQPQYSQPAQPQYSQPVQPRYSQPVQPRYSPPPSQPHYSPPPSAPSAPRSAPSAPASSTRK